MQQDHLRFDAVATKFLKGWKVFAEEVKRANKQSGMIVQSYHAAQISNHARLHWSRLQGESAND
jgi:hypothetical protein